MQGWFLGVLCSFASSLMNNTGLVLQKVSILNEHERVNASQRPCWEQPLWWVGMVVFLVSQVPNVIALKLASLTLIAPLGAVCLVVNIVNSHLWLHEHIHLRDLAATGLVVLGCVISVVVAPSSDRQYGFAEMYDFFIQAKAILFFMVFFSAIYAMQRLRNQQKARLELEPGLVRKPFAPALAGVTSAGSMFMTRAVACSLSTPAAASKSVVFYAIAGALVIISILTISYLNLAMQEYDARMVIPIHFSLTVVLSIFMTMLILEETAGLTFFKGVMFFGSVCVTMFGVYLLNSHDEDGGDGDGDGDGGNAYGSLDSVPADTEIEMDERDASVKPAPLSQSGSFVAPLPSRARGKTADGVRTRSGSTLNKVIFSKEVGRSRARSIAFVVPSDTIVMPGAKKDSTGADSNGRCLQMTRQSANERPTGFHQAMRRTSAVVLG